LASATAPLALLSPSFFRQYQLIKDLFVFITRRRAIGFKKGRNFPILGTR
jgi:hypothetical protein